MQSVPITTTVVSSNPTQTRQHYVTHGRWFSLGTPVSSTNKTDIQDITQLLLEMPLNAINPTVICDKVISNIKLIGDYRL